MPSAELLARICKLMPKVELHAHLNGSITQGMLDKILQTNNSLHPLTRHPNPSQTCQLVNVNSSAVDSDHSNSTTGKAVGPVNLSECFQVFAKIHELITTPKILHWVTKQVIEEFYRDNVIYLELRTTPKIIHDIPSKDVYMESVIQAIMDCRAEFPLRVKLLVSVDRKLSIEEADENVQLAVDWKSRFPEIVVGIDLSGDPTKGSFHSLLPSLLKAREHGLQLSCHLPEVTNPEEARQMLQFRPDRVGHALYIHPQLAGNEELWELLKRSRIPVEVCLTSNLVTKGVESLMYHHVQYLDQERMPFVICTDDAGVFQTSLSNEYTMLTRVLNLAGTEHHRLRQISVSGSDFMFSTKAEKADIKAILSSWWDNHYPKLLSAPFETDVQVIN